MKFLLLVNDTYRPKTRKDYDYYLSDIIENYTLLTILLLKKRECFSTFSTNQ